MDINKFLSSTIFKYYESMKEDLANTLVENSFDILFKSLKYYGLYKVLNDNFILITNTLVFVLLMVLVIVITNTSTTKMAIAPLFIIIIINFLCEICLYTCIGFILYEKKYNINGIKLIRSALVFVFSLIYLYYHCKSDERSNTSQISAIDQPQVVYNMVVNNHNGYKEADQIN
jgi:hypothetical protein